ncbi:hypothetical protein CORC01_03573 [Colletotrichum orchidophilum]|uniref:CorA-like Mg2+ transporter n=1 Tax=Colletotrichum orchidophilum TaxID=1209926 RepID=A0A1G4BIY5_9PEZI|nr:uncharacterized protein CORC01_03573 [Colletotrichum orchidophilum]OHF01258.1 hypothetical protein CORC01_03573 [Colletotrichum orchidophilum]
MAPTQQCFVDEVVEPVRLYSLTRSPENEDENGKATQFRQKLITDLNELSDHLAGTQDEEHVYRFISICQRHSWRPLQITSSTFDLLMEKLNLDSSLRDLASCFYTRNTSVEEVFCMPYTQRRKGSVVEEASYTVRYPEHKPDENSWVIRQTGVYHRSDSGSRQSLSLMMNPMPTSQASNRAIEWLSRSVEDTEADPFWLHKVVFETYLPLWRSYIASLERQFLPLSRTTFANFVDEPSTMKFSHLTRLASLENRFLQIPAILESSEDTLKELSALCANHLLKGTHSNDDVLRNSIAEFDNFRRQCRVFSRTATYLHQRAQTTSQLLANTLSFREQLDTRKQNDNMLSLNKSVVFITTLTLLYLPPSFVAVSSLVSPPTSSSHKWKTIASQLTLLFSFDRLSSE